jgi:hypothetical protein
VARGHLVGVLASVAVVLAGATTAADVTTLTYDLAVMEPAGADAIVATEADARWQARQMSIEIAVLCLRRPELDVCERLATLLTCASDSQRC